MLLFGPPGLGKTTLSHIIAHELGVNLRQTSGPVLERAGRPRGAPHQPRAARRAVHRRDPSAVAGRRGDPLSGARGLPDRHHDRRRPGGALREARPAAVHAGRRDHARRHAHQPAARPLRHRRAARVLHRRRADAHRARARRALLEDRRSTPTARARSRAARAARRASPTGCCAACATTPRCKRRRRRHARGRRRRAVDARRRCARGST